MQRDFNSPAFLAVHEKKERDQRSLSTHPFDVSELPELQAHVGDGHLKQLQTSRASSRKGLNTESGSF